MDKPIPAEPDTQEALLPEGPVPPPPKPLVNLDLTPENKTKAIVVSIIGVLLVITLIALATTIIVLHSQSTSPATKPPPAPPTPIAIPVIPSQFSTDSAVLNIRSDVQKLIASTSAVDFIEPEISPPNLDLNLRVQSQ